MKRLLRTTALLALLLVAKCGREPQDSPPYEDPADCKCRVDPKTKKTVCTGACPSGGRQV